MQKPFSLSRETSCVIPSNDHECEVILSNTMISLKDPPPLDYWEVDPAWDGKIFRSACQARRSNRSTEIPLELKMPAEPTNVCVRAVTVGGSVIQSHIQPVTNTPDRL
jgi:hypothetical protein